MSIKKEDFTNRALALLLRQQDLETDFEQKAGRKRLDVVAHMYGLRVVLEAETSFHRKAQAKSFCVFAPDLSCRICYELEEHESGH